MDQSTLEVNKYVDHLKNVVCYSCDFALFTGLISNKPCECNVAAVHHVFFLLASFQLDFAINGLLSLNMVVTLLIAFLLDNTVPGSRQERGVYIWSKAEDDDIGRDPSSLSDYNLPGKVSRCFRWAKCLGVR